MEILGLVNEGHCSLSLISSVYQLENNNQVLYSCAGLLILLSHSQVNKEIPPFLILKVSMPIIKSPELVPGMVNESKSTIRTGFHST